MTLKQFYSKEIWRAIKSTNHHEVSNRGRVRNKLTGNIISHRYKSQTSGSKNNSLRIIENGNETIINARHAMLAAFQDLEITQYIQSKLSRNKQRVTGVYRIPPGLKMKKKWRVIIQKNNAQHLFGYFRTKEEATEVATRNWFMLNQDKIERYL